MPIDKNNEFNNFLIYAIIGLGGLFISLIGIIYNLVWKNIKDLWTAKKEVTEKVQENSEHLASIQARCEERGIKK